MAASVTQARANFEIKARCADLPAVRERAEGLATAYIGIDHQVDTYFVTRCGRLKLRESSLSGGQLVPYLRPDRAGPRRSDYRILPVPDPAGTKALLSQILGVHRVVEKQREIFLVDNVRIHLDRVEGLGTFLELEAVFDGDAASEAVEQKKVERLMRELGVQPSDLVATSYEALLAEI
jgi:predicted adenylyl cyclase CyaB